MTRALLKDIKFFILENYIKILMSLQICKVIETDLFTLVCLSKACFSSSMGCLDSAYSLSGRGHISMPDDLFVGNHSDSRFAASKLSAYQDKIVVDPIWKGRRIRIVTLVEKWKLTPAGY